MLPAKYLIHAFYRMPRQATNTQKQVKSCQITFKQTLVSSHLNGTIQWLNALVLVLVTLVEDHLVGKCQFLEDDMKLNFQLLLRCKFQLTLLRFYRNPCSDGLKTTLLFPPSLILIIWCTFTLHRILSYCLHHFYLKLHQSVDVDTESESENYVNSNEFNYDWIQGDSSYLAWT